MKFEWKLDRPLAVFDIEATGTSPRGDRIIDLAILKLLPGGGSERHYWRVHPERLIPPEVTRIHGISDADVAGKPAFSAVAAEIFAVIENCDFAGFNVTRFDIPMLEEEFVRAGYKLDVDSRRVVDAQVIFHRKEPRDLSAALAFYCKELHLDAHSAMSDVDATLRVLEAQLSRYTDLPHEVAGLDAFCNLRHPEWADRTGRLKWSNKEVVLNFGKRKGESLRKIVQEDPGFVHWMLRSDFPRDTKDLLTGMIQGRWPTPPEDADNLAV